MCVCVCVCVEGGAAFHFSLTLKSKVTIPQDAHRRLVLQVYLGSNTLEFSATCTVGAKIKFTFHFRTTLVLRYGPCLKDGVKFLLRKRSTHRFYGFWTGETLARFITAASHVKHCSSSDMF